MSIAEKLCTARSNSQILAEWPETMPPTLAEAYAVQAEAVLRWAQPVGGWKVGLMAEPFKSATGVDRWLGPAFAPSIRQFTPGSALEFTAVSV